MTTSAHLNRETAVAGDEPSGKTQPQRLSPVEVAALYLENADALRRFLRGVLRDAEAANDVLHAAFAKLLEVGHTSRPESRRAWLFQVAYREAMAIRRRRSIGERVLRHVAWMQPNRGTKGDETLVRRETLERVRNELRKLPEPQQQIVLKRVYETKTFAEISQELNIPLGTALGRMRAALKKLRRALDSEDDPHQPTND
jgi:RNA polymerase sigma-70 factor (ECF subfamily)